MDMQTVINAQPALPVSKDSLWDRAAEKRDELATLIDAEFNKENIVVWIRKSKPGEYPLYVAVESWKQISETKIAATFDRSSLKITISVVPYLENALTYNVELIRHGRELSSEHWVLSSGDVAELARYLINGGQKPHFFEPRVSMIERIIGAFIPFVGNPPENKLISEARPNYWTGASILGLTGILGIIFFSIAITTDRYTDKIDFYILCVLVSVAMVAVATIISRRRPNLDAVPKQSLRTPRREFRVDSWHVSVPGAGEKFERFRDRLYDAVAAKDPLIEMNHELHQSLTPRGFEERERLVLAKGQATLHIHVYPFSNDAFVGWESYLNWNRWAEGATVSKTVRDGKCVTYHSLQVGVHVPTDFDLIEADALAETVHRVLVNEVKGFLKEREIEADLDFKIIRGDRARALKEGEEDGKK